MKLVSPTLLPLVAALSLLRISVAENESMRKSCFPDTPGIKKILSSYMKSKIAAGAGEADVLRSNHLISPLSMFLALLLVFPGAGGATAEQLAKVLFRTKNSSEVSLVKCPDGLSPFGVLEELGGSVSNDVNIYYKALFDSSIHLKQSYFSILKDAFHVKAETDELLGAEWLINLEVERATHDRIKNLLSRGTFNKATKFVIVNALYFRAEWFSKFFEQETVSDDFYDMAGNAIPAKFMKKSLSNANYGTIDDNITYLELPYQYPDFVMVLFKDLNKQLIDKRGFNFQHKLFGKAKKRVEKSGGVNLKMPRFSFTTDTMDMIPVLKDLGLPALFDPLQANFSGISDDSNIIVDRVLQKAFVRINENGTDEAAATAVVAETLSAIFSLTPPVEFILDRPFAFAIVHKPTKLLLFEGFVGAPTENQNFWEP